MTIRKILTEPDPFLRQKSQIVKNVDDEIRSLMDDMLETMYDAKGIGLAAIQIGVPKRIIVLDISKDPEKKEPMYFVNPIIKNKYEFVMGARIKKLREPGSMTDHGKIPKGQWDNLPETFTATNGAQYFIKYIHTLRPKW